jgi:hypothetical protein
MLPLLCAEFGSWIIESFVWPEKISAPYLGATTHTIRLGATYYTSLPSFEDPVKSKPSHNGEDLNLDSSQWSPFHQECRGNEGKFNCLFNRDIIL